MSATANLHHESQQNPGPSHAELACFRLAEAFLDWEGARYGTEAYDAAKAELDRYAAICRAFRTVAALGPNVRKGDVAVLVVEAERRVSATYGGEAPVEDRRAAVADLVRAGAAYDAITLLTDLGLIRA